MMKMLGRVLGEAVHVGERLRPGVASKYRDIERFYAMPADLRERALVSRMRELLSFHSRLEEAFPEWGRIAGIENQDEFLAAWREMPLLAKEDLQERFSAQSLVGRGVRGRIVKTGGSTGMPTEVIHDRNASDAISAMRIWAKRAKGWRPGMPVVGIWGSDRDIGKSRRRIRSLIDRARRHYLIGGFGLDSTLRERLVELTKGMERFFLFGYTSMLRFVAKEILRSGDERFHGRIVAAWNGAETLTELDLELSKAAFGVPLLNHYGGRELSTIAFQPNPASSLLVARPNLIVELVDERQTEEGHVIGKVVCTSLVGYGTPVVRYEIGDFAVALKSDYDSIGPRSLRRVEGRTAEAIPLPDGTMLHGVFWYHLMTRFDVAEFRVEYGSGGVRLKVVAPRLSIGAKEELERVVRNRLHGLPFSLELVNAVPRTVEGKLNAVVRVGD